PAGRRRGYRAPAMRVLVATTAGAGHFGPMQPFAAALRQAGHEVVVAAPASFAGPVARAGFEHRPFADASPEELGRIFASLEGASNEEGNAVVIREVFGRLGTRAALPGMATLVDDWRPDLVMREPSELSSFLVAESRGVPQVQVSCGLASFDAVSLDLLREALAELGADPGLGGLRSATRLSLLPASFDLPADGLTAPLRFRDDHGAAVAEPLPAWWVEPDLPLVYVTFGSVAAGLGLFPSLYLAVMEAVADLPVQVLLTTGEAGDPATLSPVPANVHVEAWWPQGAVMPHAAAMVGHGGFGTTLLGLAAGVPMVVVPLFADQPHNARRVEEVGAGVALHGGAADLDRLPAAVMEVLGSAAHRGMARGIAAEIADLPPVSDAVAVLEAHAGRS
ncbi:MAG TPA: glycosyltransferase, partial [Acidimicrobiales bacterium]|nr:glycosyltransferase [Acidimicrobiales bacterium]